MHGHGVLRAACPQHKLLCDYLIAKCGTCKDFMEHASLGSHLSIPHHAFLLYVSRYKV